jgi:dTDP-4-dehydrorhamnose 3,5-epimerase
MKISRLPGMERRETGMPGVYRLTLADYVDSRGTFSPAWVGADLAAADLDASIAQVNFVRNPIAGTLRGLHFQTMPWSEVKIVQVLSGAIFDVVVDLRAESSTFKQALAFRLDAHTREALYLPKGLAHGYQTLVPDTAVLYTVSAPYSPDHQGGIRWDDPELSIQWPLEPTLLSDKDRDLPWLAAVQCYPGGE